MDKVFGIADAIYSIYPGTKWVLEGDSYEGLNWLDEDVSKPTEEDLNKESARLQEEYEAVEYQRLREKEYPDFREYLDGIVKADQDQIDAYIAACLTVKDKYPKPSV